MIGIVIMVLFGLLLMLRTNINGDDDIRGFDYQTDTFISYMQGCFEGLVTDGIMLLSNQAGNVDPDCSQGYPGCIAVQWVPDGDYMVPVQEDIPLAEEMAGSMCRFVMANMDSCTESDELDIIRPEADLSAEDWESLELGYTSNKILCDALLGEPAFQIAISYPVLMTQGEMRKEAVSYAASEETSLLSLSRAAAFLLEQAEISYPDPYAVDCLDPALQDISVTGSDGKMRLGKEGSRFTFATGEPYIQGTCGVGP